MRTARAIVPTIVIKAVATYSVMKTIIAIKASPNRLPPIVGRLVSITALTRNQLMQKS